MTSPALTSSEVGDRIFRFCAEQPERFPLYLPLCNAANGGAAALRATLGLARRELWAMLPGPWSGIVPPHRAEVLLDATVGDKHAALWLPLAQELARGGVEVGLAIRNSGLTPEIAAQVEAAGSRSELVRVPESAREARQTRSERGDRPSAAGLQAIHGAILQHYVSRLRAAWRAALEGSRVSVVVTTTPLSPWSGTMLLGAKDLGITTVYLMQGLPSSVWGLPCCDVALVSSPLGQHMLAEHGWADRAIHVVRNPSVPNREELVELRAVGRSRLQIADTVPVALFLGQKSLDQCFPVRGYVETCRMVGRAMASAAREAGVAPVLRPHYAEQSRETEGILRNSGVAGLRVSTGAPLWQDLAAADIVISMHSAALEEAHLAGKSIVQAVASGLPLPLDFGVLGASVVRDSDTLAETLCDRRAWRSGTALPSEVEASKVFRQLVQQRNGHPARP